MCTEAVQMAWSCWKHAESAESQKEFRHSEEETITWSFAVKHIRWSLMEICYSWKSISLLYNAMLGGNSIAACSNKEESLYSVCSLVLSFPAKRGAKHARSSPKGRFLCSQLGEMRSTWYAWYWSRRRIREGEGSAKIMWLAVELITLFQYLSSFSSHLLQNLNLFSIRPLTLLRKYSDLWAYWRNINSTQVLEAMLSLLFYYLLLST
jgi:hypothetical protein